MIIPPERLPEAEALVTARIKDLYLSMQEAYDQTASQYDFSCEGCKENCCTQRFFHYTLSELLYLHKGLRQAPPALANKIMDNAQATVAAYQVEVQTGEITPVMCPINFDGLCQLYEHRPMICRLHGLPHVFTLPDGSEQKSGGCGTFVECFSSKTDLRLDRTPFYSSLAQLEKDLRTQLGLNLKYKMTTAEMLLQA